MTLGGRSGGEASRSLARSGSRATASIGVWLWHRVARPISQISSTQGNPAVAGCMHGRHRVIVCGNCSCKWIASVIRGPTACPTRSYQTRRCLDCRLDRKVRRWRPGLGDATRGAVSWAVSTAPSSVTSQIKHMETRRSQVEGFEIGVED